MITREAIEAACAVLNERDKGNAISIPDVVAMLTAAFAAAPKVDLPSDIAESLLAIGPVEWGVTHEQSDEEHISDMRDTLRITREYFSMPDGPTSIHGVYLEGTEIVLAHTGMSPNSPQHARILVGAWNQLVEQAKSQASSTQEVSR